MDMGLLEAPGSALVGGTERDVVIDAFPRGNVAYTICPSWYVPNLKETAFLGEYQYFDGDMKPLLGQMSILGETLGDSGDFFLLNEACLAYMPDGTQRSFDLVEDIRKLTEKGEDFTFLSAEEDGHGRLYIVSPLKETLPLDGEQIASITFIIASQAKARSQEFDVHIHNIRHEKLIGDPLRFSQVLINILGNSVKFTPIGGRITLDVAELPGKTEGETCLKITTTDTGTGMNAHITKPIDFDQLEALLAKLFKEIQK